MPDRRAQDARRFGTFGGVFTPCTLTILGVILFLRYGQVVGNAGLWWAIGILGLSKLITTLTALSVSAIATNTKVEGGGAYFMISRSLGVEFGGSIGLVFFLAQAVSVAMYVIGFTEAVVSTFPSLAEHSAEVASTVNLAVFVCVFIGAGWTIKLQYGILAVLLLSLVSFAAGAGRAFDGEVLRANLSPGTGEGAGFFRMFALFFPAATGIMAGANMSGDLKQPSRSIPRGTLGAIAFTAAIYLGMAVLLAGSSPREDLVGNNMVVRDRAAVPWLIAAGVFAATLSSAIGSMMGAPRVLQALAKDRIFRRLTFFATGAGSSNEPRRAVVATFVIAQMGILVGNLDLIAPVITMFFMVTYGYLNLATFYESYTRNPSYRPTFKLTHWTLALAGTLFCAGVMFLIDPLWALVSVVLMAGLHRFLARRSIGSGWGDVRGGAAYERARRDLLRLEEERYHPKNWRPSILAFTGGARARVRMVHFGAWLCGGRGILSLGQVITGDVEDLVERRRAQERSLRQFISDEGLEAFPAVVVSSDRSRGLEALAQCHGLGAFRPNTVLAGWSDDPEQAEDFVDALRNVRRLGMSLVLYSGLEEADSDPRRVPPGTLDVWWRGKQNGPLMVLLAHLMTQVPAWREHTIRLLRVVPNGAAREESERHLRELLQRARIEAEVEVVVDERPLEAIARLSARAAVVLLGFELPPDGEGSEAFLSRYRSLLQCLPTTLLVHSSGDASLDV